PPHYKAIALPHGIVAAGVVEASSRVEDNAWILDLIRGDDFFRFFVGSLEVGAAGFRADLERLAQDERFVGIRSFLWSPAMIALDAAQRDSLGELSRRGMTLDLISRRATNPKPTA